MSEIVFDATDPDVTSARQTEELRLMEQGSQLIEKQEAEAEDKYRRSELEAQEHKFQYVAENGRGQLGKWFVTFADYVHGVQKRHVKDEPERIHVVAVERP